MYSHECLWILVKHLLSETLVRTSGITTVEVPRLLLYCYGIKLLVLVLRFEANWPKYHNELSV